MIMGVAMAKGRVIRYSHTIGMQTNFGPGFYYPYDVALAARPRNTVGECLGV